jgi:hypothetical protein
MSDSFDYNFEEVIRLMGADRMRIFNENFLREIIRWIVNLLPVYGEAYKKACEISELRKASN